MALTTNDVIKIVLFGIAMIAIAVIAVITAITTGNAEHWIQVIISGVVTLAATFGIVKSIKTNE